MAEIEKQVGEYIKGEFVKERGITVLKIEDEPKDVDGQFGTKLECKISYQGQKQGDPYKWTLNKKSRNMLIDKYSIPGVKFNTNVLIGKEIPIETAVTEKGRAIYVDEIKLKAMPLDAPTTQTEIVS